MAWGVWSWGGWLWAFFWRALKHLKAIGLGALFERSRTLIIGGMVTRGARIVFGGAQPQPHGQVVPIGALGGPGDGAARGGRWEGAAATFSAFASLFFTLWKGGTQGTPGFSVRASAESRFNFRQFDEAAQPFGIEGQITQAGPRRGRGWGKADEGGQQEGTPTGLFRSDPVHLKRGQEKNIPGVRNRGGLLGWGFFRGACLGEGKFRIHSSPFYSFLISGGGKVFVFWSADQRFFRGDDFGGATGAGRKGGCFLTRCVVGFSGETRSVAGFTGSGGPTIAGSAAIRKGRYIVEGERGGPERTEGRKGGPEDGELFSKRESHAPVGPDGFEGRWGGREMVIGGRPAWTNIPNPGGRAHFLLALAATATIHAPLLTFRQPDLTGAPVQTCSSERGFCEKLIFFLGVLKNFLSFKGNRTHNLRGE